MNFISNAKNRMSRFSLTGVLGGTLPKVALMSRALRGRVEGVARRQTITWRASEKRDNQWAQPTPCLEKRASGAETF